MNKETYDSIKEVVAYMHRELNKIKSVKKKFHELVTLNIIEKWIYEVEAGNDIPLVEKLVKEKREVNIDKH